MKKLLFLILLLPSVCFATVHGGGGSNLFGDGSGGNLDSSDSGPWTVNGYTVTKTGNNVVVDNSGDAPAEVVLFFKNLSLDTDDVLTVSNSCRGFWVFVSRTLTMQSGAEISMTDRGFYDAAYDLEAFVVSKFIDTRVVYVTLTGGDGGDGGDGGSSVRTSASCGANDCDGSDGYGGLSGSATSGGIGGAGGGGNGGCSAYCPGDVPDTTSYDVATNGGAGNNGGSAAYNVGGGGGGAGITPGVGGDCGGDADQGGAYTAGDSGSTASSSGGGMLRVAAKTINLLIGSKLTSKGADSVAGGDGGDGSAPLTACAGSGGGNSGSNGGGAISLGYETSIANNVTTDVTAGGLVGASSGGSGGSGGCNGNSGGVGSVGTAGEVKLFWVN